MKEGKLVRDVLVFVASMYLKVPNRLSLHARRQRAMKRFYRAHSDILTSHCDTINGFFQEVGGLWQYLNRSLQTLPFSVPLNSRPFLLSHCFSFRLFLSSALTESPVQATFLDRLSITSVERPCTLHELYTP